MLQSPYIRCVPSNPDSVRYIHRVPSNWNPLAYRWWTAQDIDPENSTSRLNDTLVRGNLRQNVPATGGNPAVVAGGNNNNLGGIIYQNGSGPDYAGWHHISIAVHADLTYATGQQRPPEQVHDRGSYATVLKARASIAMPMGKTRFIDFDIGAGVEATIAGMRINEITLLVPDPTALQQQTNNAPAPATRQHDCQFSCAVYQDIRDPMGHARDLTHTTPFGLNSGSTMVIPVMPDVRYFDVVSSGPVNVTMGQVSFVAPTAAPGIDRPPEAYIGAPNELRPMGQVNFPANGNLVEQSIPGGANALIVQATGTALGSLIQQLRL